MYKTHLSSFFHVFFLPFISLSSSPLRKIYRPTSYVLLFISSLGFLYKKLQYLNVCVWFIALAIMVSGCTHFPIDSQTWHFSWQRGECIFHSRASFSREHMAMVWISSVPKGPYVEDQVTSKCHWEWGKPLEGGPGRWKLGCRVPLEGTWGPLSCFSLLLSHQSGFEHLSLLCAPEWHPEPCCKLGISSRHGNRSWLAFSSVTKLAPLVINFPWTHLSTSSI